MKNIKSNKQNSAVLSVFCPDRSGIVATVTELLLSLSANIVYLDQYVDRENSLFFMRIEWDLDNFSVEVNEFEKIFRDKVATRFNMSWEIFNTAKKPRMAIFVSKYAHCLFDLLGRWKSGNLAVDIPIVISNHEDLREEVERFGIGFYHIPVTAKNRNQQATVQLDILKKHNVDFITLARYMQIIPESLINKYPNKIINIHHSFLPGFPGAKPYHQAYDRGVKLIGATAHYVTKDLDAGPIIYQSVERVNHTYVVDDLIKKGQDIEMQVLARAVSAHVDRKVLAYKNRTVVFG